MAVPMPRRPAASLLYATCLALRLVDTDTGLPPPCPPITLPILKGAVPTPVISPTVKPWRSTRRPLWLSSCRLLAARTSGDMSLCTYPGCNRAQAPRNLYCRPHADKLYRYGSPGGRPIPRQWLYFWAIKARRVLEANSDHAGIRLAVDELQRLLDRSKALVAAGDQSDPVSRPLALLVDHGGGPIDVLMMVAAVALFDRDNPRFFLDTEAYQLATARAVCCYIPRRTNAINKTGARRLGSMLVERYAGLTAGILKALDNAVAAAKSRDEAMAAPLTP